MKVFENDTTYQDLRTEIVNEYMNIAESNKQMSHKMRRAIHYRNKTKKLKTEERVEWLKEHPREILVIGIKGMQKKLTKVWIPSKRLESDT